LNCEVKIKGKGNFIKKKHIRSRIQTNRKSRKGRRNRNNKTALEMKKRKTAKG